jgi:hypothetical protein
VNSGGADAHFGVDVSPGSGPKTENSRVAGEPFASENISSTVFREGSMVADVNTLLAMTPTPGELELVRVIVFDSTHGVPDTEALQ